MTTQFEANLAKWRANWTQACIDWTYAARYQRALMVIKHDVPGMIAQLEQDSIDLQIMAERIAELEREISGH